MSESYTGKINRKLLKKRRIIDAAAGREPADLVLKNATYVNVFSNELCTADIAVAEGLIVPWGSTAFTNSLGETRELSRWMWASRKPGNTILPEQSVSTAPE